MKQLNSSKRAEQTLAALGVVSVLVALMVVDVRTQGSSSTGMDSSSSTGVGVSSSTGVSSTAAQAFNFSITNSTIRALSFPTTVTSFCNTTDQGELAAYDNTTICIIIGGVAKVLYYPVVEDFSLLQLTTPTERTGAFDLPTQWFQAEFSGVASPAKYRRPQDGDSNYVVPFWTLIITLDNGRVDSLQWDDGCLGSCSPCVDSTCAIPTSNCASQAACDPKFYVGWFGTDRTGRYLTSAGKRYSRFRSYSLSSAFNNAYTAASEQAPKPTDFQFSGRCGDGITVCESDPSNP